MPDTKFNIDDYLPKNSSSETSVVSANPVFNIDDYLGLQDKDITGLGIKQAEDFNRQLATRTFDPVQAYQQFENYGKQMSDYYTERGYSPQQIEKIKKEFVASADPRNKTNWWDYYVSDRANDVMVGTGNLLVDALAAVPENIPVLGKLADDAEKYTRDVTQAWQNAVSDKQKIQTYLGERAEKEALANGAGELGGLWANLKENPMQMASLFSQQAPQLALGALGKIPAAITYMMGGAGRVRNDIEQAYDDTYKNNPAQLLQLPEIQSRMKQGMSFEQAVNDAKTDITDNWKSIVAGAAVGGTEALVPFGKVGQGVNRGVVGTFAKEIGQEAFQEGAEQLNSNLAVGQIDGKTKASDNVVRNAALGGIAGGLTGIPSAVDAYLNRDSGAENLVDQLSQSAQQGIQANEQAAERATQGQDIEIDGVNQQVLEQVVSGISDQDLRDSYYDELKKDIQDGVIEERANSSSTYGKMAQAYLQAVNSEQNVANQPTEAEVALQQTANIAPTQNRNVLVGGQDSVDIGENNYQPFQYEVIEASELSPTQQKAGNQLRDRDRVASQSQVNKIARNLDPRKLADSPTMEMGAPLLAQDGKTIIAGNGRSMAIRQAYQEGLGENYRQYLYQNATKFGLDQNQLATMQNPVLVRRLNTAVDIKQTAINSNEQGGMRMSNLEQAKVDAGRLPNMANFELGENGELNTTGNQGFIRQFIQNQPENLRNELLDSKGNLSQTGVQRLRNAMLYTAYGDTETLARAVESTDVGARNIITALTRIAPKVAQIKQDISNGSLSDVDISNDIVSAVEKYNQLKSQNRDVNEYLQQQDFVGELSAESKSVLQIFNENARSAKRISDVLTSYYNTAEVQGNTSQSSMFGDVVFDKAGTLEQAKNVSESDIRHSLNENKDSPFAKMVDRIIAGYQGSNKRFVKMGTTPDVLKMLGFPDTTVSMREDVFNKVLGNKHFLTPESLKRLPEQLNNPIAVTHSRTIENGYLIFTELTENVSGIDKPIVAALHVKVNNKGIDVIDVASAYGRNVSQINEDLKHTLYWNKQKGYPFANRAGLQLPNVILSLDNLSANHIKTEADLSQYQSTSQSNPQTLQDQQALSRLLGEEIARHIEVVDRNTVTPPKGETIESLQNVEGWYDKATQKAYIYADGITADFGLTREERLAWVAWHELAHKGLDVKYRNVLNAALQQAKSHSVVATISRFIQQSNPDYTENVAIEEALVELYSAYRTGNWDSLNQRYNTSIHPSYAVNGKNDMGSVFQRFVAIMRRLIAGLSKNKRAEMMAEKDLFNLLKRIDGSVMELANSNPTENTQEQSDVRYSLNENADSAFAKAVDAVANGNTTQQQIIDVGTTPNVLKMLGLPDANVVISGSVLRKVMLDKHNVTAETLKQLPKQINDPVAVMKSSTQDNGYVVLTELMENVNGVDKPVVAALHLKQSSQGLELINIASVYGRNNSQIQRGLENDLLYWNKEKGAKFLDNLTLQLRSPLSEIDSVGSDIKTETDLSQYQDKNSTDDDGNTRYSRKAKKDEMPYQRDLMVTHNISADGIMHANKMGGLPYASVAVAKQDNPLTGFGEVTLIGDRHYIDPKGENKAKVFGADIYSPRYPDVTYEYKESDKKVLQKLFEQSAKEIEDNAFDYNFAQGLSQTGVRKALLESDAVKYQFLKENGIAYEPAYRTVAKSHYANFSSVKKAIELGLTAQDLTDNITIAQHENLLREFIREEIQQLQQSDSPLVKRAILRAEAALNGDLKAVKDHTVSRLTGALNNQTDRQEFDAILTKSNMRKAVEQHKTAFNQYVENIASQFVAKEKIRKGENRNGEATYMAHTLENVVKKLKKDLLGGESMNYGLPSIRSKVTPKFKSIEDIQKNKDRLVSRENFEKVRDEIEAEKDKLAEDLGVNSWDIDDVLWNVVDENVSAAFHYADIDNTPQNRQLVAHFLAKLEAMPTEYFEGKAKDITQFSDFKGAVIPNNLPKNAYDVLAKSGLKIYEYDPSESGSRTEIIKQATNELDKETEGNVLFSRKQSVADLAKTGKAKAEPTVFDDIKARDYQGFKQRLNKAIGKLDEWVADGLRPVNDWIDGFKSVGISAHEAERLKDDMYRAKNVRDVLNSELEQSYVKPLIKQVAKIAKANKLDELSAKRMIGYWVSGRYAIEKNNALLKAEYQAMLDAEQALNDATKKGDTEAIESASREYRQAERQYRYRKHDVELALGSTEDFKVGTAGGWSNAEAVDFMQNIEKHIPRKQLEEAAELLYDLNQRRLEIDHQAGRYTEEQYNAFKANRHYVPLTGNPYTRNENGDDGDWINGAGQNAINVSKDRALKGRRLSEAEDGIDASWRAMTNSTTYAGWVDFKNRIDTLYEGNVAELVAKGYSERSAREETEKTLGISKAKLQGLTRSSDDVLIRKVGGVYYEYRLPKNVMTALKNDNVEHANAFLTVLSKPTSWYARGVTQWTLTFAPMNMMRDTWEKSEFIRVQKLYDQNGKQLDDKTMDKIGRAVLKNAFWNKDIWTATKRLGFNQPLRDSVEAERMLEKLLALGGVSNYSTYFAKTETDLVKTVKAENSILGKKLEQAGELLSSYNKVFDTVSALSAYKAMIDNGIDPKQAAAKTLELTNFRKTGSKMKGIKALYMFSQPTAMGARNLIKYLSTPKGRHRFIGYMAVMIPLYLALRAMDDDDEGGNVMDQLGDITRYIPLPLGLGKYLKIPVGFGMPQMAWNFSVNIVKAGVSDMSFTEAATNMFVHSMKTFAPISPSEISAAKFPLEKLALTATPTILQPLMQNVLNRSAFGNKITTNFVRDDKLKAEQSKSTTAQFWKDVAIEVQETLGIDMHPEQIKNLFDGYGSMLGSLKELQTVFVENPNREKLGRQTRTPFLNQFIGTKNEFAIQSRYYEASEEAQKLHNEYQSRKERGTLDGWLTAEKMQMVQWHEFNDKRMKQLRSQKGNDTKALRKGTMSPAVYENRLQVYNKQMDVVQRQLLKRWREMQGLNTH